MAHCGLTTNLGIRPKVDFRCSRLGAANRSPLMLWRPHWAVASAPCPERGRVLPQSLGSRGMDNREASSPRTRGDAVGSAGDTAWHLNEVIP